MLAELEVDIFHHYGTCIEKKMDIRSDGASINIKVKVKNKDMCLNEMGSYFDEEHSKARARVQRISLDLQMPLSKASKVKPVTMISCCLKEARL